MVITFRYIDRILNDDHLNQSEIVYSFLNPCPEYYSRIKDVGITAEPEPFFRISKKLFGIAQNSPVDEFNNKSIGLRSIYTRNNETATEWKESDRNKRSRNNRSVFPSSLTNFFNDSNSENSHANQSELPVNGKKGTNRYAK